MAEPVDLTPTAFAKVVGISVPYASQLLSDDPAQARKPSRSLAIRIFQRTGLKLGPLAGVDDRDINALARLESRIASAA